MTLNMASENDPYELIAKLLSSPSRQEYARIVLLSLTSQHTSGKIGALRRKLLDASGDVLKDLCLEFVSEIAEDCVNKGVYSSSILPSFIYTRGRTMRMAHIERPVKDDIFSWLYVWLSSVRAGGYLVNVINVSRDSWEDFFKSLVDEGSLIIERGRVRFDSILLSFGNMRFPLDREYCAGFAFLNFFSYWLKMHGQLEIEEDFIRFFGLSEELLKRFEISDEASLVIAKPSIGRRKGSMAVISKLKSFLTRWYSEYWADGSEYPQLGIFLASMYVVSREKRDLSADLLNKLLYDLTVNERVNGEILDKLIQLRADSELIEARKKRIYGFPYAGYFLEKALSLRG